MKVNLTVHEVSKISGVSIRTLHYYDEIGLLSPSKITMAGYRIYDESSLDRLQQILLFKELAFPLKEIRDILLSPSYDKNKVFAQQIALLEMKKERLENLISFAKGLQSMGVDKMNFKAFDKKKMQEYAMQAKENWGNTKAFQEFAEKTKGQTDEKMQADGVNLMQLFVGFGKLKTLNPADEKVQAQVKKLKDFITDHYYQCDQNILLGLGNMYVSGGEMTQNIDASGGEGTASFVQKAIEIFCRK